MANIYTVDAVNNGEMNKHYVRKSSAVKLALKRAAIANGEDQCCVSNSDMETVLYAYVEGGQLWREDLIDGELIKSAA